MTTATSETTIPALASEGMAVKGTEESTRSNDTTDCCPACKRFECADHGGYDEMTDRSLRGDRKLATRHADESVAQ